MKVLEILNNIYNLSKDALKNIIYHKENPHEFLSMCIYVSILENAYACIALMKLGLYNTVYIILRNLLEALIDLINLSEDENYLKVLEISTLNQDSKLLKNSKKKENMLNPYLKSVFEKYQKNSNIDTDIQKNTDRKRELIEFLAQNYDTSIREYLNKDIPIYYKFKKSDNKFEYESIYGILCTHSHNNLNSLIHRHAVYYESGEIQELHMFKNNSEDCFLLCDTLTAILTEAIERIYMMLKIDTDSYIEKICNQRKQSSDICIERIESNKKTGKS